MPETITDDDMIQMLSDMGFDQKMTALFMELKCYCTRVQRVLKSSGNTQGQIKILNDVRSVILDNIHREESQIYRIDYLIYWINNSISHI